MLNSAIITPVLAAGSTDSPYLFQVNISQRLCKAACASEVPVFAPAFSLVGYSSLGGTAYVATISVQGLISYVPCGENCCCATKTQVVSQTFTVPFTSATAPTSVSISQGTTVNALAATPCQRCSRSFVSETPVFLNVA